MYEEHAEGLDTSKNKEKDKFKKVNKSEKKVDSAVAVEKAAEEKGKQAEAEKIETGEGQNEVGSRLENLEERATKLEEENSFLKDQLLRKTADFENFRKRMFREKGEGIKYANSALLSDLIGIIDDFERAIQSAGDSRDFDSFHTGVSMIEKQLVNMLDRNWGLKRFNSTGEEFDPEKHQAIAIEEIDENETSVVLEDYQKGYYLHDRVLRPARVKVSKPASPTEQEDTDT